MLSFSRNRRINGFFLIIIFI